ncbi:MAG TPA: helix-hairpin-helix domain-containing protein [Chthoniobacterales bacterium]|nr:helix-hairpin-helix domain-containing protein [Chthoniobacterales bacterium]
MIARRFFCLLLGLCFSLGANARAEEHWVTYRNCRLLANPSNDGDSFHVRAAGQEYIFRLYFVDAPETDAGLPERVADQAKYFRITAHQAVQVGLEAERFTREKLSQPFSVETCRQDALGRSHLPRYYAFVEIGNDDLAEDLVRNGLARVFGAKTHAPDRPSPDAERRKLQQLERDAKSEKIGAWGASAGRLKVRAALSKGCTDADAFEAFFHPKTPTPSPVVSPVPGTSAPASVNAKLDINSASDDELESLPGVGPVLAAKIIAGRPFESADELQRVPGIGPKRYAHLRPFFQ